MEKKNKCLIDADSILYLTLPGKNNPEKTYEECLQEIDNRIQDILLHTNSDRYILFLTEGKCFRYRDIKVSNAYKHRRQNKKMPPIFYALKEHMKQHYNAYCDSNLEADDLVSFFKNEFKENTIICSPDKDVIYQNSGVHYNYKKNIRIHKTEEEAMEFLFLQLGMGDFTDGISGIEGVGEKTVLKWFDELKEKYPNPTYEQYASLLIDKYINKYDIHEGIHRFFETFRMVYLLKTQDDMMRELNYIPETPEFNIVETNTNFNIA